MLTEPKDEMKKHLSKKLEIKEKEGGAYYYLAEIWQAEEFVTEIITKVVNLPDLNLQWMMDYNGYINNASKKLVEEMGEGFDQKAFYTERTALYRNVFKKRFYVLAGAPGTGKSHELLHIVDLLKKNGEDYMLLTPTGKAALRLTTDKDFNGVQAQTMDKFLVGLGESAPFQSRVIQNLIIDEMSMVDLVKFCRLLRVFNFESPKFKRLILVGDPNQLAPIGFGKVFVDIVRFLTEAHDKFQDNHISLEVNCRQKLDDTVIEFARVFSGENKNYEKLLQSISAGGVISKGLHVAYWNDRGELCEQIVHRFKQLFCRMEADDLSLTLNRLFNLNDNGSIKDVNAINKSLKLDAFQIITPYRTGYYGGLGLNNFIQKEFRKQEKFWGKGNYIFLKHSDKVIQIENVYSTNNKKKELILSNGSIGMFTTIPRNQFYFPEKSDPLSIGDIQEEKLELGYAITVHKAQGSGFDHVFFVLPQKKGLLSRELLYTALTRSREGISVFIYGEHGQFDAKEILEEVRRISHVGTRKTTLLGTPIWEYSYSPAPRVIVKSRAEYIIYRKLQEFKDQIGGFEFEYEKTLKLENKLYDIHPDFTIELQSGRIIYWEHLGLLGKRYYEKKWAERFELYQEKGLEDNLLTTDERSGIHDEKIGKIIEQILNASIRGEDSSSSRSKYHYSLGLESPKAKLSP